MDKPKRYLIAITAGGVNKKGLPGWLTMIRLKEMLEVGMVLEKEGDKVEYACVLSSPVNDGYNVMHRIFGSMHPQYDKPLLIPPDGMPIKKQRDRNRFLQLVAERRRQLLVVVSVF